MYKILFVCLANRCRSPMGKACLDKAVSDDEVLSVAGVEVRSAGLEAVLFAPATEETIIVMQKMKLNVDNHMSTPLGKKEVEWADMVITMDQEMKAEIASRYPKQSVGKLLALDCPDPTGLGVNEHRSCASFMESVASECVRTIKRVYPPPSS